MTSKIDSRTILGEQGAEQLLGQGDMLYMAGGGRITRVRGPSSRTRRWKRSSFLKTRGSPTYIDGVTEETEDDADAMMPGGGNAGDDLYDQAVALVAREGKASTNAINVAYRSAITGRRELSNKWKRKASYPRPIALAAGKSLSVITEIDRKRDKTFDVESRGSPCH